MDKTDLHARVNWALAEKPFEHAFRNNWQPLRVMTAIGGYPTPLIKGMRALKWQQLPSISVELDLSQFSQAVFMPYLSHEREPSD